MALAHWLWLLAAVVGLVGLVLARPRARARRGGGTARRLAGALLVLLALLLAGGGLLLRHWSWLPQDVPAARLHLQQDGVQRFRATLATTAGERGEYVLLGDEWQLDARVVRWARPLQSAGLPPVYRFERLSGRYGDPKQDVEATRSVHDLRRDWDFWEFHQRRLARLPLADARFGSATYLPMLDGATYDVYVAPAGGLVAKPADEATEALLRDAGW